MDQKQMLKQMIDFNKGTFGTSYINFVKKKMNKFDL